MEFYAAFCTALAAATVHCGVGTSIDVPLYPLEKLST